MKLGIMQPYFLPYLGYFDLINYADRWVVFDTAQYIRHGWVNRNRILHPQDGWQYFIVPLQKHDRDAAIKDVLVAPEKTWRDRILGQLAHYKKRAPFYQDTVDFVADCLALGEDHLSRLNTAVLAKTCAKLGIEFDYIYFSESGLELGPINGPGDWALRISAAMEAEEYVNPPGGASLFDAQEFQASGIRLTIREFPNMVYDCGSYEFVPALSVIDALMWNSPQEIKSHLDSLLAGGRELGMHDL